VYNLAPVFISVALRTSHGSMSVFQVGIGFSVCRSVFFQVGLVFVIGFSKYHDIGSVFLIFHFASKSHVRILKFCFQVSSWILTEVVVVIMNLYSAFM